MNYEFPRMDHEPRGKDLGFEPSSLNCAEPVQTADESNIGLVLMKQVSVITGFILLILPASLLQAGGLSGLHVGDRVPGFVANDDTGNLWNLAEQSGEKNIVLYFYPAAMTGGCTKQACAYRDRSADLEKLDAVVVGVSGDSVNNLRLFKQAHQLNFALLSDIDGRIAHLFGVPTRAGGSIEREIDGKPYILARGLTTARWTFVIGKDRRILYKNTEVRASDDTAKVIEEIEKLGGGD